MAPFDWCKQCVCLSSVWVANTNHAFCSIRSAPPQVEHKLYYCWPYNKRNIVRPIGSVLFNAHESAHISPLKPKCFFFRDLKSYEFIFFQIILLARLDEWFCGCQLYNSCLLDDKKNGCWAPSTTNWRLFCFLGCADTNAGNGVMKCDSDVRYELLTLRQHWSEIALRFKLIGF